MKIQLTTQRFGRGRFSPSLVSTRRNASGFTLMEVSVILSVLAILSVILLPQIRAFIHDAQRVRARNDLQTITNSLILFLRDVGPQSFRLRSVRAGHGDRSPVALLVSSGDIPELGRDGDARWLQSVNGTTVDFLDNYLVTNTPGGDPDRHFPTPREQGFRRFAWRGAYTSGPIDTDPWGNRYMVNVQFMEQGLTEDVVVYSAGPNEKVETEYARDGLFPGGDDLIYLFSPDRKGGGGS